MQFKDIIGQEEAKAWLRQAVQEGRVPHAQMFVGPQGVGKLQLAVAYAQYLNCPHRTAEDSCGICPTCLQYRNLQHPDLHFVFPVVKKGDKEVVCDDYASEFRALLQKRHYFDLDDWYRAMEAETKQGMIYDRESSEILRKLRLKAFGDGYKIMIIWHPEKMNASCANKLLKLLEEPPERTVFLLVGEAPEQLLSTILSRVQQVRIPKLTDKDIVNALQEEKRISQQEAVDFAHIANGSYLAARKLAESAEELQQEHDSFVALMRDAYTVGSINDAQKKFESLQRLYKWSQSMADAKVGREKQKRFLQYTQRQIRENYICNFNRQEMNFQTGAEREFSSRFARYIHMGNAELIMAELEKAERQIEQNGNAKVIFFDLCLQLVTLIKRPG